VKHDNGRGISSSGDEPAVQADISGIHEPHLLLGESQIGRRSMNLSPWWSPRSLEQPWHCRGDTCPNDEWYGDAPAHAERIDTVQPSEYG
jgi:hypothetical protein